jgi:hypothetical protein
MRREHGQALAEYHVLIPGAVMVTILVAVAVGAGIGNLYETGVDVFLAALQGSYSPPTDEQSTQDYICVEEDQITGQNGGSFCEENESCDHIEPLNVDGCDDFNNCSIGYGPNPSVVVIKAGRDYQIYIEDGEESQDTVSYTTEDGCYQVSYDFGSESLTWIKLGGGSDCKDASHLQAWQQTMVAESCSTEE